MYDYGLDHRELGEHFLVLTIAKIRTNSHELHSETWRWSIPKTPWAERVFHMCESMSLEDENHFFLVCFA